MVLPDRHQVVAKDDQQHRPIRRCRAFAYAR
jgi:hypothetical protein